MSDNEQEIKKPVTVNFAYGKDLQNASDGRYVYIVAIFEFRNPALRSSRTNHREVNLSFLKKNVRYPKYNKLTREKVMDAVLKLIEHKIITPIFLKEAKSKEFKSLVYEFALKDPSKLQLTDELQVAPVEKLYNNTANVKFGILKPVVTQDLVETGVTTLIAGSSFSGKTYFLVQELNKLSPGDYDLILLMTESKHASDLRNIRSDLNVLVVEGFHPEICTKLKRINDLCDNRFRFLLVLDDIVDQKNSKILAKMLLIYRNANISTVILIQYLKLISKAQRGSFHQVVLCGFRSQEDYMDAGQIFDLFGWARELMHQENQSRSAVSFQKSEVATWLKKRLVDKNTKIFLDQKHGRDPIFIRS